MTATSVVEASSRAPFDLIGPLPSGRLAIEASAGTGKTFTLAALATRFVAEEGVAASELLVVTFTRAATSELRDRIRTRLAEAAEALVGTGPVEGDELLVHLAAHDRPRRQARLAQAVTEFDAATIATIHGFATQALGTLGASAGGDRDAALVEDARDLQAEVAADVLATAATEGHDPADLPTLTQLVGQVEVALRTPDLHLAPPVGELAATAAQHLYRELVARVAVGVGEARRRTGTRSFDGLLTDLRQELAGPNRAAVTAALRGRYRVALIDEFQDTDPVQWAIFSELFGPAEAVAAGSTLVLVGDPKQAIYSFRGADIHTYLAATGGGPVRSLGTNHRSDGAVLAANRVLLDGATFGDAGIAFAPVEVRPAHRDRRLTDERGAPFPAVSLRLALDADLPRNRTKPFAIKADDADHAVAGDLVAQVRHLLDHGRLPQPGDAGDAVTAGPSTRRLRPSDVAVLTRSADEGDRIQAALLAQGVPAVLARGGSVLTSPAADQWRLLLHALARPADARRARAAALSWFVGRSPAWVADATDDELAVVQDQVHAWAEVLVRGGVDDLLRVLWADSGVVARVLARPDGDRSMTDLDHIAELLRTAPGGRRTGVAGLLAALEEDPQAEADADLDGNLASRRIESEAEAVQIMTVWVAKGLEFPVVCCPGLWRGRRSGTPIVYQDQDLGGRALDLAKGETWPDKAGAAARKRLAAAEQEGEDLRLLYVALTRARHHTIVWWTRATGSDSSALARVLFARQGTAIDPVAFTAPAVELPPDDEAAAALQPLVDAADGAIAVGELGPVVRPGTRWSDPSEAAGVPALAAATLDRPLDRGRHRWSFTAVTARAVHESVHDVDAEPGASGLGAEATERRGRPPADEPAVDDLVDAAAGASAAAGADDDVAREAAFADPRVSPLAGLPAGAAFGTFVHAVLEVVDFADHDLAAAVDHEVGRQLAWRPFDLTPLGRVGSTPALGRSLLVDGLEQVVRTPLGPTFDGRRLADIARSDRLDELAFELRLGDAGRRPTDRDVGRLVLDHLPAADPFRVWAEGLAAGAFDVELAGHLTGSIDLLVRVAAPGREPRYVVVDYKTNRLHERGLPSEDQHYAAPAMAAAMAEHHYPLQALLYAVAVHRYLRWRQPGYDPAVHLGGAAYLFVRGMSGAAVPTVDGAPNGVSTWAIPPALVVDLSALLDGRPGGGAA